MGRLEDALRSTFADRVAGAPAVENIAGRVVRQAVRRRRRQTVAGTLAVVLGLGTATAGLAVVHQRSGGEASPQSVTMAASPLTLPIGVLIGHTLWTGDGSVLELTGLPEPRQAWRVATGWLIESGVAGRSSLWWVRAGRPDGAGATDAVRLAAGTAIAVGRTAAGDVLVAVGQGGAVTRATFDGEALVRPATTTGTGDLRPIAIVGDTVVLGDGALVDTWVPGRGGYKKGPQARYVIVGGNPDRLFGVTAGASACLVEVSWASLAAVHSRCSQDLAGGATGLLPSPDGRWLAVLGPDGTRVAEVGTAFAPTYLTYPLPASSLAWLDSRTFVIGVAGGSTTTASLVRLHVDSVVAETVFVDAQPGLPVVVIPDLRR